MEYGHEQATKSNIWSLQKQIDAQKKELDALIKETLVISEQLNQIIAIVGKLVANL